MGAGLHPTKIWCFTYYNFYVAGGQKAIFTKKNSILKNGK